MTDVDFQPEASVASTGTLSFGLIFELEHVAIRSRELEFEVLKSLLADKERELTLVEFARFSAVNQVRGGLEQLLARLDAKRFSASKLEDDFNSGMLMHYKSCATREDPAFKVLLETARSRSVASAGLSGLAFEAQQVVGEQLNLHERGVKVFSHDAGEHVPRADSWLKVAKELGCRPRHCFAVVTSGAACKAALAAGMRVIAVPDQHTAYQDFGGSYAFADTLGDINFEALLERLPI